MDGGRVGRSPEPAKSLYILNVCLISQLKGLNLKTETSRDERVTKTQTSRRTDRQTGRQIDRATDREIQQSPRCTEMESEGERERISVVIPVRGAGAGAGHGTGYGTCRTKVTKSVAKCSCVRQRGWQEEEGGRYHCQIDTPYTHALIHRTHIIIIFHFSAEQ